MIVDLGTSALGQRTVLIDVGVRQSLRPVAAQVGPPVAVRVAAVVALAPRGGGPGTPIPAVHVATTCLSAWSAGAPTRTPTGH